MMNSKPKDTKVKECFKACQDSFSIHPKLIKKLKCYHDTSDPDVFFTSFMYYLQYPLSGFVEKSVFLDRTLEFVAKFACSFLGERDNVNEETQDVVIDDELPPFLYRLFAWLLDHHEVEGADARLRVCQLINKILKYMGEDACIDDDLYNKIYDGMLDRLKDKVAEIRSQAATALQRLQDPKDDECPITKAYLFHLVHDPNNVVRRTIVRCLGATRRSLPHILERTRDTDEFVRRAAYKFLAEKVHIKSLTIGQREGLLYRGLGERSDPVRKVVEKELLPAWLRLSGDNIVKLLHHLDVGNSEEVNISRSKTTAPAAALQVLFQEFSAKLLVENFHHLNAERLVPYENLTAEIAIYWRVLAQYLRQKEEEECLENLLPELTPFCQYVRRYILEMEKDHEDVNWEFVAKELIIITTVFDLADETGRQYLLSLVKALLCSLTTPVSFIPCLMEVFTKIEKDPQTRVNQVAEFISELKDPMQSSQHKEVTSDEEIIFNEESSSLPEKNVNVVKEREIMEKQMEAAKLRVSINEIREELCNAIAGQDFLKAQEVKSMLDKLEEQQVRAEEEVRVLRGTSSSVSVNDTQPENEPSSILESVESVEEANSQLLNNPTVTLKCLKMLTSVLQDPKITNLNATLHTLLETFVGVSVQSKIVSVRREAISALCCLCLRSIESSRQHMLLLLHAAHIDVLDVRIAAISAVVDLLMRHGLASFITDRNGCEGGTSIESCLDSDIVTKGATLTQTELNNQGGNSVVAILTKILDDPNLELRTEIAEGLCKLLMIGALTSPKLLSRLLLMWYSPMTESSSKLRHILGTFFPLYCSASKRNQIDIEAAFIPTMRVLFDAPITSPLSEIDVEDVGMFFVNLTREDLLQSFDINKRDVGILASSTTSIHDTLAIIVSNEILSFPHAFYSKVLVKVLISLNLTNNNYVHLRELKVLSEQLLLAVKEKTALKQVEKFNDQLGNWLAKDPVLKSCSSSKRRSSTQLDENDLMKSASPSPSSKKRALFSPRSGSPLESLQEETADNQSSFLENTLVPSPVEEERCRTGKTSGNISVSGSFIEVMSSTRMSRDSSGDENDKNITIVGGEMALWMVEDTEHDAEIPENAPDKKCAKASKYNNFEKIRKSSKKATNITGKVDREITEKLECLELSECESDDDIFSDTSVASSVTGANFSKLSKNIIPESSDDEEIIPSSPKPTVKVKGDLSKVRVHSSDFTGSDMEDKENLVTASNTKGSSNKSTKRKVKRSLKKRAESETSSVPESNTSNVSQSRSENSVLSETYSGISVVSQSMSKKSVVRKSCSTNSVSSKSCSEISVISPEPVSTKSRRKSRRNLLNVPKISTTSASRSGSSSPENYIVTNTPNMETPSVALNSSLSSCSVSDSTVSVTYQDDSTVSQISETVRKRSSRKDECRDDQSETDPPRTKKYVPTRKAWPSRK